MSIIKFATPTHFRLGKLERIGFVNNFLFIALRVKNSFEIWRVHCFIPSSWVLIFKLNTKELFYNYFTLSLEENCIYALVLAIFKKDDIGKIALYCINADIEKNRIANFYLLANECLTIFEQISLEGIGLGYGSIKGLYIFDRSMIRGIVPFWQINFNYENSTFLISAFHILHNSKDFQCSRYPILINGDKRAVLKLTNENKLLFYNSNLDKWGLLLPCSDNDLDLSKFYTRGIGETFGHDWHRCSAIESPISIFSDNGFCIFKIYQNGQHTFYKLIIESNQWTFSLRQCSCIKVDKRLEVMFYLHCFEDKKIAFVNKYLVGFVDIQPLTLKEISFWALQKNFANEDSQKIWHNGKSEKVLKKMLNINECVQLI